MTLLFDTQFSACVIVVRENKCHVGNPEADWTIQVCLKGNFAFYLFFSFSELTLNFPGSYLKTYAICHMFRAVKHGNNLFESFGLLQSMQAGSRSLLCLCSGRVGMTTS